MILTVKQDAAKNKPLVTSIIDDICDFIVKNMGEANKRKYLRLGDFLTLLPVVDAQKKLRTSRYNMQGVALANTPTTRQSPLSPGVTREIYQLPVVLSIFYDFGSATEGKSELYDAFLDIPALLRYYDGAKFGVMRVQVLNQQMSSMFELEKMDMVYQINLLIHGMVDYAITGDINLQFTMEHKDFFGGLGGGGGSVSSGAAGGSGAIGTGNASAKAVTTSFNDVYKTTEDDLKDLISVSYITVVPEKGMYEYDKLVISDVQSMVYNYYSDLLEERFKQESGLIQVTDIYLQLSTTLADEVITLVKSEDFIEILKEHSPVDDSVKVVKTEDARGVEKSYSDDESDPRTVTEMLILDAEKSYSLDETKISLIRETISENTYDSYSDDEIKKSLIASSDKFEIFKVLSDDRYQKTLITVTMIEDKEELIPLAIEFDEKVLITVASFDDIIIRDNVASDDGIGIMASNEVAINVYNSGLINQRLVEVESFKTGDSSSYILRQSVITSKMEASLVKTTYDNSVIKGSNENPKNSIRDKAYRPGLFVYWAEEKENGN